MTDQTIPATTATTTMHDDAQEDLKPAPVPLLGAGQHPRHRGPRRHQQFPTIALRMP